MGWRRRDHLEEPRQMRECEEDANKPAIDHSVPGESLTRLNRVESYRTYYQLPSLHVHSIGGMARRREDYITRYVLHRLTVGQPRRQSIIRRHMDRNGVCPGRHCAMRAVQVMNPMNVFSNHFQLLVAARRTPSFEVYCRFKILP